MMEIIIVDGYSIDNTINILNSYLKGKDIRTKIFFENKGLGHARQIVVDNAEGKYILWVDADMILTVTYLSKMIDFIEKNENAGIAKGKYGICKQNNLVAYLEDVEFALMSEKIPYSRPLATSGCIYRVKAIRDSGGFDEKIKGSGEDMDLEQRVRSLGWTFHSIPVVFYEQRRKTWKSFLKEYFWHGKGASYLVKKHKNIIKPTKIFFPAMFLKEIQNIALAYRLTKQKKVFLLPIHYLIKRIAWFSGFIYASYI
jgi:glycosyltransferase involved in cell wall biosynthesis